MNGMAAKVFRGLFALLPAPIWACSCAPNLVQYCERVPDPSNQQQAIFVGVVREFYPKSREQMHQIWNEFYQSHPDLRSQPAAGLAAALRERLPTTRSSGGSLSASFGVILSIPWNRNNCAKRSSGNSTGLCSITAGVPASRYWKTSVTRRPQNLSSSPIWTDLPDRADGGGYRTTPGRLSLRRL